MHWTNGLPISSRSSLLNPSFGTYHTDVFNHVFVGIILGIEHGSDPHFWKVRTVPHFCRQKIEFFAFSGRRKFSKGIALIYHNHNKSFYTTTNKLAIFNVYDLIVLNIVVKLIS